MSSHYHVLTVVVYGKVGQVRLRFGDRVEKQCYVSGKFVFCDPGSVTLQQTMYQFTVTTVRTQTCS